MKYILLTFKYKKSTKEDALGRNLQTRKDVNFAGKGRFRQAENIGERTHERQKQRPEAETDAE